MDFNPLELKIARIRAGIPQRELAARVGIWPSRLSEYENGRRRPPPEVLERLRRLLEEGL